MAYIGNRQGPKESAIVQRLGHEYFGISPLQLEEDLRRYRQQEAQDLVVPVRQDKMGRYYLLFSAPETGTQRFYLEAHGYPLEGQPRIYGSGGSASLQPPQE